MRRRRVVGKTCRNSLVVVFWCRSFSPELRAIKESGDAVIAWPPTVATATTRSFIATVFFPPVPARRNFPAVAKPYLTHWLSLVPDRGHSRKSPPPPPGIPHLRPASGGSFRLARLSGYNLLRFSLAPSNSSLSRGKKVNVGEITVLAKFILLIKFTHRALLLCVAAAGETVSSPRRIIPGETAS